MCRCSLPPVRSAIPWNWCRPSARGDPNRMGRGRITFAPGSRWPWTPTAVPAWSISAPTGWTGPGGCCSPPCARSAPARAHAPRSPPRGLPEVSRPDVNPTDPGNSQFDIIIASDLRLPGGNSASIEEEVRAQARAGFRTGLLHVNSRLANKRDRSFDAKMRQCIDDGAATLIPIGASVSAPLVVLRNATVFSQPLQPHYDVSTDQVVLVVNHVMIDAAGVQHFDPVEVDACVQDIFGHAPRWAPISPTVRASMGESALQVHMAETDWKNLIDVDEWHRERAPVQGGPVLGRHSRAATRKWPAVAEQIQAACPDEPGYQVRGRGGSTGERGDARGRRAAGGARDWSSGVCSSDLAGGHGRDGLEDPDRRRRVAPRARTGPGGSGPGSAQPGSDAQMAGSGRADPGGLSGRARLPGAGTRWSRSGTSSPRPGAAELDRGGLRHS